MELTFTINTDDIKADPTLRSIDVAELLEDMTSKELEMIRRFIFWVAEQNI